MIRHEQYEQYKHRSAVLRINAAFVLAYIRISQCALAL